MTRKLNISLQGRGMSSEPRTLQQSEFRRKTALSLPALETQIVHPIQRDAGWAWG